VFFGKNKTFVEKATGKPASTSYFELALNTSALDFTHFFVFLVMFSQSTTKTTWAKEDKQSPIIFSGNTLYFCRLKACFLE